METLILGALGGIGFLILWFTYFLIKDVDGLKGKIFRWAFYIFIGAIIFFFWVQNPERVEDAATWLFIVLIAYFCGLKPLVEHFDNAAKQREEREAARYENIIAQLERINEKLNNK